MKFRRLALIAALATPGLALLLQSTTRLRADGGARPQLSAPFSYQVLATSAEAPLALRLFTTAVKTDSRGEIITGTTSDPVKNIVGPESAGERGGMERFTKIMFGADYINGRPDPGTRIDPNHAVVKSGSQLWPNRPQPFRSQPRALALTPDGRKLYVTLPGREGYPDWRVAVVDAQARRVLKWIDLRPPGTSAGLRPIGIKISPNNTAIYPRPYAVVLNQYGNFASVIDTGTDTLVGDFATGTYAEKVLFNSAGTRLYITDRFKDEVRAYRIEPGPKFTQIAEIPTGTTQLERANPRDLDLSADGRTLYVANTLGHTIAAIDVANDANRLVGNLPLGGLATDVKISGRWGIVSGQATGTKLNGRETGHGLPTTDANGVAIKNNGQPLGYTPVMTDATKATTFDDIGSELNIFDTQTNLFVFRYVDKGRDFSQLVTEGQVVDLQDHTEAQRLIRGSGPEQMVVKNGMLFVSMLHSDKVEVFRVNQTPADASGILSPLGFEFTGGITPEGVEVSPDGRTAYVANMQTEDISFLGVDQNGNLSRQGYLAVGVTPNTPDPKKGGNGSNLFATDEEVGLRWFFTSAYADDGPVSGKTPGGFDAQKSCAFCHWDGRQDGCQWNVAANALGGVKVCPQNKDISDNWPEWYEGLNNDFMAYASACNGEVLGGERAPIAIFPQPNQVDRFKAREQFVLNKTEENSRAINRPELNGKAFKVGYYDMAYLQILWSQNKTRLFPNPLAQVPTQTEAEKVERGRQIFTNKVSQGGAGCADCHHNGNTFTNGVLDDTFQDFNIHEPGVISEMTVDGKGPFYRPETDYFFEPFAPPQDVGTPQNFSSRNTKHLRAIWDATPRYLHHGAAHTLREVLLAPDSPLLAPGERGFNFRTVRTDQSRATGAGLNCANAPILPTQVPITVADASGALAGDGKGPIYVSLDNPFVTNPDGTSQIDRLGTSNLAPLLTGGQINLALAANNIQVIKETHGKTSHLSAADLDALISYMNALDRNTVVATSGGPRISPTPLPSASPAPTASASPSASASASPSASATVSPSTSPTASATPKSSAPKPLNISTRVRVESGENVLIGGFIVTGNVSKKVAIRAIGPSLTRAGVSGALSDPTLQLRNSSGAVIASNNNWRDSSETENECRNSGVALSDDRESAIIASLSPGAYTAILAGQNNTTGAGLIEVYDLDQNADAKLANISTRGLVQATNQVMIGGLILGGGNGSGTKVLIRALGPSLGRAGIANALSNPALDLYDGNGALLRTNDNWRDTQQTEIQQSGASPSSDFESAIVETLPAGSYTAVVTGKDASAGIGLIEVFSLE